MHPHATSSGTAIESKIRRSLPRLHAWYRKHHRPLPWRTRPTPYRTAVAEFMCQQTRITTVIPYYQRWLRIFPNWQKLAQAPSARVLRMWEGLGYYRRARFLHALAKAVTRLPGKDLPSEPQALRSLPGIGDYTSGAIASIAFGKATPAFDGNVARVLGRLAARKGKVPPLAVLRGLAGRLVPTTNPGLHNQALMELGALICLPKNPRCSLCPMQRVCPSSSRLPTASSLKNTVPTLQYESILIPKRNGKFWLTQTHPQGRWRGLYFFPVVPQRPKGKAQLKISYAFTRYQVQAAVFIVPRPPAGTAGRWLGPAQLRRIALPAPHRKILRELGFD